MVDSILQVLDQIGIKQNAANNNTECNWLSKTSPQIVYLIVNIAKGNNLINWLYITFRIGKGEAKKRSNIQNRKR